MKRSSLTRSTDTQQACENDGRCSPSLSLLFSPNFCLLGIILLIFAYVTTRSREGLNRDWRTGRERSVFGFRFDSERLTFPEELRPTEIANFFLFSGSCSRISWLRFQRGATRWQHRSKPALEDHPWRYCRVLSLEREEGGKIISKNFYKNLLHRIRWRKIQKRMKIGRKENWKKRRGDGRSPSLLNLGFARGIFVPECRDRAASSRELQASLAFVGASESRVDRRREGWYYNLVVDESCGRQQSRTSSTLRESERVLSREFRVTDRATSALPFVFRIETSLSLSLSAFFTKIFAVSFRSVPRK